MSDKSPEYLAQSKATGIYIAYAFPIPFAIVSTSLRIWAEYRHHRRGLTYDDYLMLLTTTINVAYCIVAMIYGPQYGLGRHREVVSDHMLKMIMLGDYILSHMYQVGIVTTKLSVLALYHRAFPSVTFHRIVLLTGTIVFLWLLAMEFVLIGLCKPVRKFWDEAVAGTCIDICAFSQFNNYFNLIADVWIFVLPLPIISRLRISTKKKIGLGFVFSIGLATCGLSIARVTFVKTECEANTPWKMPPLLIMSAWEPLGGILCANLPIIYKPVGKALRRLTGMRPSGESSEGQRSWYRRYHFDSEVRQKRNVQMEVTSADDSFNTNTTVDIEPVDSGAGLLDREIAQNGCTVGEKPK